jgi:hypothetical protein
VDLAKGETVVFKVVGVAGSCGVPHVCEFALVPVRTHVEELGGDGIVEHEIPVEESTKKTNEYDRLQKSAWECSLDFLDRLVPPWNTLGYPPIANVTLRAIIRSRGVIEPSRHTHPFIRLSARRRGIPPQQWYIARVLMVMLVLKVVTRSLVR